MTFTLIKKYTFVALHFVKYFFSNVLFLVNKFPVVSVLIITFVLLSYDIKT